MAMEFFGFCCRQAPDIDGCTELALGGGTKPQFSRKRIVRWAARTILFVAMASGAAAFALAAFEQSPMLMALTPKTVQNNLTLEGELEWRPGMAQYLGGFCFRAMERSVPKNAKGFYVSHAGIINISFEGDASVLGSRKWDLELHLFDDQTHHWDEARQFWQTSSCEEKRRRSNFHIKIGSSLYQTRDATTVGITQFSMARHWHAAIVDCGGASMHDSLKSVRPQITYRLVGADALTSWNPEESNPANRPQDAWKGLKEDFRQLFG